MAEFTPPAQQIVLAHFIVSDDVERSTRFYTEVLGGRVVFSGPGGLTYVALSNTWIIINVGGGPTDDKPTVTLETPRDPDRVSNFLNIRVADIHAVYSEWSARGAQFLTPPKQHQYEIRCYIRDPDGHLIEVGQTTDPSGDWTPARWPSYEHAGAARFVDAHTLESDGAPAVQADKVIICTGGASRRLAVPGFELTATHSDAWELTSVPPSLLVLGGGATGVQVASIFNAFGSHVRLVECAPRILMSEDEEVSRAVSSSLRTSGIEVEEDGGTVERFEPCPAGVRMVRSTGDGERSVEAAVLVVAIGWEAATSELRLDRAGVEPNRRGYINVDAQMRTTAPHIFAAGDVTGRAMVVHEAAREGLVAATNAVLDGGIALPNQVSPLGSFTDPEYASVGLSEAAAREAHNVAVATQAFESLPRPIIDGRETGFCKLVVDRELHTILGCHIVGERAVELAQLAAMAMAGKMTVEQVALVPFSFPTYANALGRAAVRAAIELDLEGRWVVDHLVTAEEVGVS